MKRMRSGALALGALLILAGCGSVSPTDAPPPQLTPPPPTPPPPVSTISATLSVPLADLNRIINEKAPQHFADLKDQKLHCGIGDCRASLSATRTGPITLSGRGGALGLSIPFALSSTIALPPPLSSVSAGANMQGQLNATTALTLGADWQIKPNTGGTVQFQNGKLQLGPLNTDFAAIWNSNAALLSSPLFGVLDTQMAPALSQQKPVAQLWAGASVPIKLNANPALWLVLTPERIRVGPPAVANNALIISLGVDVRARLLASDTTPDTAPGALPAPAPLKGPANSFSAAVPVVLPYGEAARMALDALAKNPPRAGSHSLKITTLEIMPSGQDVVIKAGFCITQNWDPSDVLSGCGSGYLRGVPQYDAKDQTIRIANVKYDVLTQNMMLSTMRGLTGDDLGKAMEKALQFKVGGQIKQIQSQVSAALAKPQGGVVSVSGAVQSFGPVSLSWSKDGFIASFSAQGSVHADLHL
jgi:hypothetical protein